MIQPRPTPAVPGLVTRRSTAIASLVAVIAVLIWNALADPAGGVAWRPVAAVVAGVVVVVGMWAWGSGLILALRTRTPFIWLWVVVLLGPLGSLACAALGQPPAPPGKSPDR